MPAVPPAGPADRRRLTGADPTVHHERDLLAEDELDVPPRGFGEHPGGDQRWGALLVLTRPHDAHDQIRAVLADHEVVLEHVTADTLGWSGQREDAGGSGLVGVGALDPQCHLEVALVERRREPARWPGGGGERLVREPQRAVGPCLHPGLDQSRHVEAEGPPADRQQQHDTGDEPGSRPPRPALAGHTIHLDPLVPSGHCVAVTARRVILDHEQHLSTVLLPAGGTRTSCGRYPRAGR
jgi:hypothetical protein